MSRPKALFRALGFGGFVAVGALMGALAPEATASFTTRMVAGVLLGSGFGLLIWVRDGDVYWTRLVAASSALLLFASMLTISIASRDGSLEGLFFTVAVPLVLYWAITRAALKSGS